MDITEDLIKHTAELARIRLSSKEIQRFKIELQEVLSAFSKLDKIDVLKVSPSIHPIELSNVTREDIPKECLSNDAILSNTKHKKDRYFKGPNIV